LQLKRRRTTGKPAIMPNEPIRFSGEEVFPQGREEIYGRLTDLSFMSKTIPGLQKVEHADAKTLRCIVKPRLSFLSGSMKLTFEIIGEEPPGRADMRMTGKGIGSSVVAETAMEFMPEGAGTRVRWKSEVKELAGLSKAVSRTLIEAAARKLNAETWSAFRRALERV
jgi:carbon monoxide dehydrogenase subunit G